MDEETPLVHHGNAATQPKLVNGEVIIKEGVCNRQALCFKISYLYFVFAMIPISLLPISLIYIFEINNFIIAVSILAALTIMCFIMLFSCGIIFGYRAASSWRLYLTNTGIHYAHIVNYPCGYKEIFIPLSDIEDVFVNNQLCSQIICVKMDPHKVAEYMPSCAKPLFCIQNDYLGLPFADNASDFVTAAKRQLGAQ